MFKYGPCSRIHEYVRGDNSQFYKDANGISCAGRNTQLHKYTQATA